MAVSGVSTTSNQSTLPSVPTLPASQQLGETDFLNLLVTQLKNQDPLKPVDNQEFVAQLAQFSQLQQSTQQVTLLQQMNAAQIANQQYSLLPLIGHQVEIAGPYIELGNEPATINYTLSGKSTSTTLTILNENNEAVRVLNLGAQAAGEQQAQWDGLDKNGAPVPQGTYKYSVSASNNGTVVSWTTSSLLKITGVQPNEGQSPSLLAGKQAIDQASILAIR